MANVTDINDKIYTAARAAGVPSEELAREMTAHYIADTERLGLGRPDHEPLASEYVEPIVGADRRPRRRRPRLRGRRRRLLPRPLAAVLRRAVAPDGRPDGPGRGRRGRRPQGGSARFRALEGREGRRGQRRGSRRGAAGGRAGTSSARRWPSSCWASSSTSTAAAPTCSSRTTRTRRRRRWPRAGSRSRACGCTTGCSSSPTRRCRSPRATSAGCSDALDEVGRDALLLYFIGGHYRQPIAYTRERLDEAARQRAAHPRAARRLQPGESPEDLAPLRDAFFDALADDFNTAEALARAVRLDPRGEPARGPRRRRRTCARCSRCSALDNLLEADGGPPPGARRAGRAAHRGARGEGLCRGGPPARRGARGGLGDPRRPGGPELVPVRRDRLRPQRRSREALPAGRARGRGGSWATSAGRRSSRGWPVRGRRSPRRADDHRPLRLGRPPGRVRGRRGVPLRGRRRAARAPRAVPGRARRGHRPAEPRRGVPDGRGRRRDRRDHARAALRGGHAGGLQGVGGRGRAPGRRAGPQPRGLPRATPRQAGCWVLRRRRPAPARLPRAGLPRRGRPGARRGGAKACGRG